MYLHVLISHFSLFQGPEVRSGDLPQPIQLEKGQEFTFTIKRGVGTENCVSVNYDDFVNDVEKGDTLLVDGILCQPVFASFRIEKRLLGDLIWHVK